MNLREFSEGMCVHAKLDETMEQVNDAMYHICVLDTMYTCVHIYTHVYHELFSHA